MRKVWDDKTKKIVVVDETKAEKESKKEDKKAEKK